MLVPTLRHRWFAALVQGALWLLLILTLASLLGQRRPRFGELFAVEPAPAEAVPVQSVTRAFLGGPVTGVFATNLTSPFFTKHFFPTAPPPPPPPPTTKKVEVTYHGFIEAPSGERRVYFSLGNVPVFAGVGTQAVANLFIADAALRTLTLTNPAGQTNVLPLNVKQVLEVPIQ